MLHVSLSKVYQKKETLMKRLLHKVDLIVEKTQTSELEKARRGEYFNIFRVCSVDHYEVTHSSVIAEFLNPKGSHGQGVLFLEAFLKELQGYYGSFNEFKLDEVKVETEKVVKKGRLDILISNKSGQGIIIENKIYASDQENQLIRYNDFAKNYFNNYTILYLSLDGRDADAKNSKDVEYYPISYSSFIIDWLNRCRILSIDKPLIRETINQYIYHIKCLTQRNNMELNDDLLDLLIENEKSTLQIIGSHDKLRNRIFEKTISSKLKEIAEQLNMSFEPDDKFISKGCYTGFRFKSDICCVRFEFQHGDWRGLIGGLSQPDNPNLYSPNKLNCLARCSKVWPLGYSFINEYQDWNLEKLFEIKYNIELFGDFISEHVTQINEEVKTFKK